MLRNATIGLFVLLFGCSSTPVQTTKTGKEQRESATTTKGVGMCFVGHIIVFKPHGPIASSVIALEVATEGKYLSVRRKHSGMMSHVPNTPVHTDLFVRDRNRLTTIGQEPRTARITIEDGVATIFEELAIEDSTALSTTRWSAPELKIHQDVPKYEQTSLAQLHGVPIDCQKAFDGLDSDVRSSFFARPKSQLIREAIANRDTHPKTVTLNFNWGEKANGKVLVEYNHRQGEKRKKQLYSFDIETKRQDSGHHQVRLNNNLPTNIHPIDEPTMEHVEKWNKPMETTNIRHNARIADSDPGDFINWGNVVALWEGKTLTMGNPSYIGSNPRRVQSFEGWVKCHPSDTESECVLLTFGTHPDDKGKTRVGLDEGSSQRSVERSVIVVMNPKDMVPWQAIETSGEEASEQYKLRAAVFDWSPSAYPYAVSFDTPK